MALSPSNPDTFMREVDEAVRADALERFFSSYGRIVIGVVIAGLLALGGYLYWRHHEQTVADANGRAFNAAIEAVAGNRPRAGATAAEPLAAGDNAAYRVLARMLQGSTAEMQNDVRMAAARYGAAANDQSADPAMRHVALLRQTLLEFDTLPPATVIARLRALVAGNGPAFPAAAELTAMAEIKRGNPAAAAALFRRIAAHDDASDPMKRRARQMAANLSAAAPATPAAARPAAASPAATRPAAAAAAPARPAATP